MIADKCKVDWELRPVVKKDGEFVNSEIDKFINEKLLPEMKKTYPGSKIEKEIIGEIVGIERKNLMHVNLFLALQAITQETWYLLGLKRDCFKK